MKKGAFLLIVSLLGWSGVASALANLTSVKNIDSGRLDLVFDQSISKRNVKVDFFRDIVQFSINGVSVYPAKIMSVSGGDIKKIFAYQYTPKQIRCRLTVNGLATGFKERVKYSIKGKTIEVRILPPLNTTDKIAVQSAQVIRRPEKKPKTVTKERTASTPVQKKAIGVSKKKNPIELSPRTLNPWKAVGWLAVLVAFLLGFAFLFKKMKMNDLARRLSGAGILGKKKGSDQFLEVISTHYLGPKKSIAVVKVKSVTLVLGVTDESINLITRINDESGEPVEDTIDMDSGTGAVSAGPAFFSDVLGKETRETAQNPNFETDSAEKIREKIRKRIEGMKTL